jgi:hypothetical protein
MDNSFLELSAFCNVLYGLTMVNFKRGLLGFFASDPKGSFRQVICKKIDKQAC